MADEAEKSMGRGLCFRCEHRAMFLETGYRPRFECGMEKEASSCCYMFMPCKPVAVAPTAGEKRPIFGPWMVAGRVQALGLVDSERLRLKLVEVGGLAVTAIWKLRGQKKESKAHK